MTELFALEIWDPDKYFPRCLYRSDLYPTREVAIEAFCATETMEVFVAIDDIHRELESSPFTMEHTDENGEIIWMDGCDDIATAYDMGNEHIRQHVDLLQQWVQGKKPFWLDESRKVITYEDYGLDFGVTSFTAHLGGA